jgi:hypothetical protein
VEREICGKNEKVKQSRKVEKKEEREKESLCIMERGGDIAREGERE